MEKTLAQYDTAISKCRSIFAKKTVDYGTAWRILRPASLTDQIFIKARRIRSLEEGKEQMVDDNIESEYIGIVNYCVLAILQLQLPASAPLELKADQVLGEYDREIESTRSLMIAKNSDYGEVWRDMRISSLTDLILMKLLRVKQIEDNQGQTLISEGLDANYRDMINYAIFALIKMAEAEANS
ncbi:MAG: DUF1599 domain-containing protein [Bacteroidota bacterium]